MTNPYTPTTTFGNLSGANNSALLDTEFNNISTGLVTVQTILAGLTISTLVSGDTLYATGASALARLAKGSNGQVLTLAAGVPSWATPASGALPRGGMLTPGTILTNDAVDATNDIDIAASEYVSNDAAAANRVLITLTALVKQLDAVWAVGTNQGMRASGAAIANTTYFLFAINRPDTGVSDVAADTSATGANVTANTNAAYTKMTRIGAILREGGAIVAFVQDGPVYRRQTPVLDVSSTNPGTNAVTRTLSVPVGINVEALMNVGVEPTSTGPGLQWYLSDLATVDVAASPSSAPLGTLSGGSSAANAGLTGQAMVRVSTAAQIRSRTDVSGANDKFYLATTGWIDWTGRA